MTTMTVLDPMGERSSGHILPTRRAGLAAGDPIGILCNGKLNAAPLLDLVAAQLQARHGLRRELGYDKQLGADGAGRPCPPEWIAELAQRCKLVLVASGD